jgi:Ni,Fe-hydrogenase III large subunit
VATARFGYHKETVMRLVSAMCGNRFGRGVVVPGGVSAAPTLAPHEIASRVAAMRSAVASDVAALQRSASFLDRLRGTGPLDAGMARRHGALGPIGRGSGYDDDHRTNPVRSYDGYAILPAPAPPESGAGDALARARVRWHEIDTAAALITAALDELDGRAGESLARPVRPGEGFATGWAEAAQGEVVYAIDLTGHRIGRCLARSASFHNLVLFHDVFAGDIYTDFPFIEASFGLSYAGVAM